jgi:hypothetical protein
MNVEPDMEFRGRWIAIDGDDRYRGFESEAKAWKFLKAKREDIPASELDDDDFNNMALGMKDAGLIPDAIPHDRLVEALKVVLVGERCSIIRMRQTSSPKWQTYLIVLENFPDQ